MTEKKNLKEGQLYVVWYKDGWFERKIRLIGYLQRIDLDGDLRFSDGRRGDDYFCGDNNIEVNSDKVLSIREIQEKGEAISLKAE